LLPKFTPPPPSIPTNLTGTYITPPTTPDAPEPCYLESTSLLLPHCRLQPGSLMRASRSYHITCCQPC
jgi:hypothetical protein